MPSKVIKFVFCINNYQISSTKTPCRWQGNSSRTFEARSVTVRKKSANAAVRNVSAASWISLTAAILAGCGGSVPPSAAFPFTHVAPSLAVRLDHRQSSVSPDIARSPQLLFESDLGTSDVDVYSLPDMMLKATLTGFQEPTGECSDRHGNVWIASSPGVPIRSSSSLVQLIMAAP